MVLDTKYFGQVDIEEEKILHFEHGLLGFEDYKDYTILYDLEKGSESFFSWLQSTEEKNLAFPVVNPQRIKADYDPIVEDAQLEEIGEIQDEDLVVLLMATVPEDVEKTSVNMKAPLIINAGTRKGVQIIAENSDYEIKYYLIAQDK